jgi:hypothetical protein
MILYVFMQEIFTTQFGRIIINGKLTFCHICFAGIIFDLTVFENRQK